MLPFRILASTLVAVLVLGALSVDSLALGVDEKASLQAAMQRHIDDQSVGGVYLYLDEPAGEVRGLHPVTSHPMVLQMGDYFVLCFDFRDDAGTDVNVDFYMARKDDGYVVFHAAVDDRGMLEAMMKVGKASRAAQCRNGFARWRATPGDRPAGGGSACSHGFS